jgi:carbohydrate-binding DOMON domain-containing protein
LVSYNMGGKMSLTNCKIDEEVESDAHYCCARVVKKIDVWVSWFTSLRTYLSYKYSLCISLMQAPVTRKVIQRKFGRLHHTHIHTHTHTHTHTQSPTCLHVMANRHNLTSNIIQGQQQTISSRSISTAFLPITELLS